MALTNGQTQKSRKKRRIEIHTHREKCVDSLYVTQTLRIAQRLLDTIQCGADEVVMAWPRTHSHHSEHRIVCALALVHALTHERIHRAMHNFQFSDMYAEYFVFLLFIICCMNEQPDELPNSTIEAAVWPNNIHTANVHYLIFFPHAQYLCYVLDGWR